MDTRVFFAAEAYLNLPTPDPETGSSIASISNFLRVEQLVLECPNP